MALYITIVAKHIIRENITDGKEGVIKTELCPVFRKQFKLNYLASQVTCTKIKILEEDWFMKNRQNTMLLSQRKPLSYTENKITFKYRTSKFLSIVMTRHRICGPMASFPYCLSSVTCFSKTAGDIR